MAKDDWGEPSTLSAKAMLLPNSVSMQINWT